MKKFLVFAVLVVVCIYVRADAEDLSTLVSEGDLYWQERDNVDSLEKAISAYLGAYEIMPSNRKVLQKLAYGYFIMGYYECPGKKNREKRKEMFIKGMAYSMNILDKAPEDPEANFRYIVNKLCYRREISVVGSASLIPEIKKRLNIVMEKERFFESGGPQRIISKIIEEIPDWLRSTADFGDMEDAEKLLKEAINFDPEFALNYVYLAELYLMKKKKNLAKSELLKALDCSTNKRYPFAAENRRNRKIALERIQKMF